MFEIHFQMGDVQHIALKRYSELRKIHDQVRRSCNLHFDSTPLTTLLLVCCQHRLPIPTSQLVSNAALRECTLPDFPPAPWFTDHTKPEHMARRKKELVRYTPHLQQSTAVGQWSVDANTEPHY